MSKVASIETNLFQLVLQKVKDYAMLSKFRLSFLVVFSAVIGFVFGMNSPYAITQILWLALGGILVTGASNAINQIIERDIDKLMTRTMNRPLPAERMGIMEAILAAGIMGISGILILTWFFNPIAGVLSAISLLSYAFVYTPLKRVSSVAVFVGAIPGALPPMIGYVCATGSIDFIAIILFSIQFLWQFPHFWAIAWVQFDDYKKAGIMLLPSASGKTRMSIIHNIIYCTVLLIVSMIPYFLNMVNWVGSLFILGAGVVFLWMSFNHFLKRDDRAAKILMFGSFLYLPVVQLALIFGKI
ncbi:MAG: protoheme IX farnesyltransferase [Bacteroidetes bacterium]|nr:protoheme IX farnesyltransferase [Bacteroidota bacterium]